MTTPPSLVRRPVNPARRFVWAGAWLFVALLGTAVLVLDFRRIVGSEISGSRSEGFLFSIPFVALALAIVLFVAGVRGMAPWREFRANGPAGYLPASSVSPNGVVPILALSIVLAVVWGSGVVLVAVFLTHLAARPAGLLVALVLLCLLAMLWISLLVAALTARREIGRRGSL